ncbi:MAG TPA: farnesyl diphosphate synthase [Hyphomicrobiales bacterium]|nr:farnesyl diphosphate synthase [Hyphomicrobiales bacterium]
MDFVDELKRAAERVDEALEGIVAETDDETPTHLLATMRHGLFGGGKRLRPFLVLASARLFGAEEACALRAAAAVECVHCYSLIHDDLPAMDDDDLRRGRPTAHIAFGEAAAILAGDALLTLAFEILADPRTHPDPEIRAALVLDLARAAGACGMAGGQMLDLDEQGAGDEAAVMRMDAMKTGALIAHACMAGAILGGAAAADRDRLARYGGALGAAFQIADDLLDREATTGEMGKATGKDAEAGKATLIDLLGADAARARLKALIDAAKAELDPFGEKAVPLAAAANFVMTRRK